MEFPLNIEVLIRDFLVVGSLPPASFEREVHVQCVYPA